MKSNKSRKWLKYYKPMKKEGKKKLDIFDIAKIHGIDV